MAMSYVKILKHDWRTIFFITGGALALSLIFSLVQPFQYSAKTRILVIPSGSGLDAYSALKSAEAIGENIAQVIYTTSFFDKVVQNNSSIKNIWSTDENKKRKQWEKMIRAEVIYGTGMVDITVYHKDKEQASMLAFTIADVLSKEGRNYFGMPGLQITMVSSPLLSKYPVKPNILLNVFMGLLLGLLGGVTFTILTHHPAMKEEPIAKPIKITEPKMHFRPEEKEERKIDEEREIISMHNHYDKH
ncbi:MAG: Wzz/FepE/Etk N-terminal domain-containing protein [Patescibacteria group bacterium]|jgi:capsular polysaccharide biosynthesis protein